MEGDINVYLRAIGRLTVNFNAAENSLRRLCWFLIDPDDEGAAQIITEGLTAYRLEELTKALAIKKTQALHIKKEINEILNRFSSTRVRRNNFSHAIWRVPNHAADLSQISAAEVQHKGKEPYAEVTGSNDPKTIEATASEVYEVGEVLDRILDQLKKGTGTVAD